jgi:Tol biopolymer transport system component
MARSGLGVSLAGVAMAVAVALGAAHAAGGATQPNRWIVFSATPKGTVLPAQLYRIGTNGRGLRRLTSGDLPAAAPTFAPNGKHVVFARLGSGLFVVNVDGTGLRRLTRGDRDGQPVWSSDGTRIAFLRPEDNWRLYVMPAKGGAARKLRLAPAAGRPSWSADSKLIYTPSAGDLVSLDAKTGRLIDFHGLQLDIQIGQTANVSPDATRIAYLGHRLSTGPPDCGEGRCPQYALYLAKVEGRHNARRISNDTGPAGWSSDSKSLVYVHLHSLTLRNAATGRISVLPTPGVYAAGDWPPAWQPR